MIQTLNSTQPPSKTHEPHEPPLHPHPTSALTRTVLSLRTRPHPRLKESTEPEDFAAVAKAQEEGPPAVRALHEPATSTLPPGRLPAGPGQVRSWDVRRW